MRRGILEAIGRSARRSETRVYRVVLTTLQASATTPRGNCIVMQCRLPFCQISGRHGTGTI